MILKKGWALGLILGACIFAGCGSSTAPEAETEAPVETGTEEVADTQAYEKFEESNNLYDLEFPSGVFGAGLGALSFES